MALLGSITSLVSVIVSGAIALFTIRHAAAESRLRRVQEFALAVLPRRLDAIQTSWALLFDLESGKAIDPARANSFVEASVWLPEKIRSGLTELLANPDAVTAERSAELRDDLEEASGSPLIGISHVSLAETVEQQ